MPRVVQALARRGHGTLCFHGLPGTGTELSTEPGGVGQVRGLNAMAVLPVFNEARFVPAVALYF